MRASIDQAILSDGTDRGIADHFGLSKSSIHRHRQHISLQIQQVEKEFSLRSMKDILSRLSQMQARVERLVTKLEGGKDVTSMLRAYRECREGYRALGDLLYRTDLEKRLQEVEEALRNRKL
jgi:hypothetical protein